MKKILLILLLSILLAGCAAPTPTAPPSTPAPSQTATPAPSATQTLLSTATNTPRPTSTATQTPSPTATNTPRPTSTASEMPTQTPISTSDFVISSEQSILYSSGFLPEGAIHRFGKGYLFEVVFSPNGNQMMAVSYTGLYIYDSGNMNLINYFPGEYISGAYSPDGKWIACGGFDGSLHLWEIETGLEHDLLEENTGFVYSISWSPDGKKIASGSDYGTFRILDIESYSEIVIDVTDGKDLLFLEGNSYPVPLCFLESRWKIYFKWEQ